MHICFWQLNQPEMALGVFLEPLKHFAQTLSIPKDELEKKKKKKEKKVKKAVDPTILSIIRYLQLHPLLRHCKINEQTFQREYLIVNRISSAFERYLSPVLALEAIQSWMDLHKRKTTWRSKGNHSSEMFPFVEEESILSSVTSSRESSIYQPIQQNAFQRVLLQLNDDEYVVLSDSVIKMKKCEVGFRLIHVCWKYLSIYLFICLSTCLSIYLSIYLYDIVS